MRIGIFGGSFDPIHMGHLLIAEAAIEQLQLDRLIFMPAAQSPLKTDIVPEDSKARIDMIRLAIGGHPQFSLDDREIRRGGISYTVDTLAEITSQPTSIRDEADALIDQQVSQWFLLIGADSLADFPRWKSPEVILRLASLAVVVRGGQPALNWSVLNQYLEAGSIKGIQANAIGMPQIEISSRDIRARIGSGRSIRYMVHPAVGAYIEAKQLYHSPPRKH